jgi:chaperonin GroES
MTFKRIMADNVLLKQKEAKEATASGIILATANKEKPAIYEVVMAGPDAAELAVGDLVVVGKFTGTDITLDKVDYKFVKQEEILAVVGE